MYRLLALLAVSLVLIALVTCAAGPNHLKDTPNAQGNIAGFWRGLWHGLISPITFVVLLFSDNTTVYEVHNNGGWYNFGFLLGVATIFGGGKHGKRLTCRQRQ